MTDFLYMIALLPVIGILYYIYSLDKNPEPRKLVLKLFFTGAFGSVFLTLLLSEIAKVAMGESFTLFSEAKNGINLVVYYFIIVALVEEFSKWIVIFLVSYKHKEFDEMYDAIVYATFVSLGFAGLENILYVFGAAGDGLGSAVSLAVMRAFLSIPGHASFGVAMGYFIGKAKKAELNKTGLSSIMLILSLVVPTVLHGIFDSCLSTNKQVFMIVYYIFVIVVNVSIVFILLHVSSKNEQLPVEKKPELNQEPINISKCPACGSPEVGMRYCINCGNKLRE